MTEDVSKGEIECAELAAYAVAYAPGVTVVESEENLHEIVPDRVFWDGTAVSLGLFDDAGEVAAAAVLHENVEDAGVAVDVAVVVAHDVVVVEVLQDVPAYTA